MSRLNLSSEPKEVPASHLLVQVTLIHRSAWKWDSQKFALRGFSDVRVAPVLGAVPLRVPDPARAAKGPRRIDPRVHALTHVRSNLPRQVLYPYHIEVPKITATEREVRGWFANRSSSTRAPASGKRGQKKKFRGRAWFTGEPSSAGTSPAARRSPWASAVFIPGDVFHSLSNTGALDLRFAYVFPADSFGEVEYIFDE